MADVVLGQSLIWIAFVASLASLLAFGLSFRNAGCPAAAHTVSAPHGMGPTRGMKLARIGHLVALAALLAAGAVLLRLVLTHQFQVSYVYRYSSRDLPLHYLISAFWAGQEGTFLLWATFTGILGLIVSRTARRFEAGVMFFITLAQSFLLLILVRLSPFALYPHTPTDGAGLNPLLQDPWMVIHPPLLFLGFASSVIPAAFAMQALARGDTDDWARGALPWTAFTVLALGTPICLGGYWAYKVLGWGGYWGWDPVENGSLVPWLISVALLHGLVVQNRKGVMKRLNLFLGIATYCLVLYATFLTRSGVLGDFSVHSFVDLGIDGWLIAFLVGFAGLAFGLYVWRVGSLTEAAFEPGLLSREYGMFLGALGVVVFATLVLIGTSTPLMTRLGGAPASVATGYYVAISTPFAMLFCLGLVVVPQLLWGRNRHNDLLRALVSPAVLGVLATVLLSLLGVHRPQHLALVLAAAMAFFVNLEILVGLPRKRAAAAGGYLVHAGLAAMIIGIITSTVYSTSQPVVLPQGQPVEALGYRLSWSGVRSIEGGTKEAYDIQVIPPKGRPFTASPIMYFSEYSRGVTRRPAIKRFVTHDLYLSPQGVDRNESLDQMEKREVTLIAGETTTVGGITLKFVGPEPRSMTESKIEIAGAIEATIGDKTETASPVLIATGQGQSYREILLSDGTKVLLRRFDPKSGRGLFYLRSPGSAHYNLATEVMYLDVSLKPWINVLWIGTVMGICGLILTVIRRARLAGPRLGRPPVLQAARASARQPAASAPAPRNS